MNESNLSSQEYTHDFKKTALFVCPWCLGVTLPADSEPYLCSNCGTAISQDDLDNNKDQLN